MSSYIGIHEASRFFSAFCKAGGHRGTIIDLTRNKTLMKQLVETFQDPPPKGSIETLNLGIRARRVMHRMDIQTIEELQRKSARDILDCKNSGVTTLNEIRKALHGVGKKLKGD